MKTLIIFILCQAVVLRLQAFPKDDEAQSVVDGTDNVAEGYELEHTIHDADGTTAHIRKRRAIVADEDLRWPKAVVPFVLTDSVKNDELALKEIKRAMTTYERFTCLHFVPWTPNTNKELGLGHDGHLNFYKKALCNADLGNKRREDGQFISCCDQEKCIHEIGHAIGFIHEHQSPAGKGWIRLNPQNTLPDELKWFLEYDKSKVITDGFDIQSVMSYPPDAKTVPGKEQGGTYTYLWPETSYGENFFYLFKQVAESYKCADLHCPDYKMTCENDGYVTLVEGICQCLCPDGLDPATGCRDIMRKNPNGTDFPGGEWALPMTTSGCGDQKLEKAYDFHLTDKDAPNEQSVPNHLNGTIEDYSAEHYFCMNNGSAGDPKIFWEDGNYCIYQNGGKCPPLRPKHIEGAEFRTGHIDFWDMKDPNHEIHRSENLPDGRFDGKGTVFKYCCRDSGFLKLPMYLPNDKPLALFVPQYTFGCQRIFGMHSTMEWIAINSLNYRDATYTGITPYMKSTPGVKRMYIKHCYYVPAKTDCGKVIELNEKNTEYTFTAEAGEQLQCRWLVRAPKGFRIKLDFTQMNVLGTMPKCEDYVSVRSARLGQTGHKYCGHENNKQTIISHFNNMMISFFTFTSSKSTFTATVKVIQDKDLCYNHDDEGASYAGHVNFTRSFVPCLPWSSVTNCPHHAFSLGDAGKHLDNNYCRNPGNGQQPWCYTDAKNCKRDYCDVCQYGKRFDKLGSGQCAKFLAEGNCQTDPLAIQKCAKTCRDKLPKVAESKSGRGLTCASPPEMPDGKLTTTAKKSYEIGEKVTYSCKMPKSKSAVTRVCQSDGTWSAAAFACHRCEEGWSLYGNNCYKLSDEPLEFDDAKSFCEDRNGYLAMPKDTKTNEFLTTLSGIGSTYWIGGQSPFGIPDWKWVDDSNMNWFNWKEGFPALSFFPIQCLLLSSSGKWEDGHCMNREERFICQEKAMERGICADYLDTCAQLLAARPDMCTKFYSYTSMACPLTCKMCIPGCEVETPKANVDFVDKSVSEKKRVPEGTEIKYTCKGTMIRDTGDAVRTCQYGKLTGTSLICKKRPEGCKVVAPTANAEFVDKSVGEKERVPEGTAIHYKCKGTTSRESGDTVRTCKNRSLTGTDLVCKKKAVTVEFCIVKRPLRPAIVIRPRNGGKVKVGDMAMFYCLRPYRIVGGTMKRRCLADGTLAGQPVVCGRR